VAGTVKAGQGEKSLAGDFVHLFLACMLDAKRL